MIQSRLSSLTRDQRLVLEAAADIGPMTSGKIYNAYCERSSAPVRDRPLRGWLDKFRQYDLLERSGSDYCPECEVREARTTGIAGMTVVVNRVVQYLCKPFCQEVT
ncbi:hypothetical protein C488_14222 [Natrinema pellirubrum DSM 15624]|uniref:Uncharacterized protein n=1 Tax=Natrinema pellirubrum (strain DSM 15624 / CIP 106293 / JCM 10476 / NCIMB 786 / 157) TaxID=797303 RepID=L9YG44_NATP1|nr:hypothetical protein C488_14222 [Natrinema pellirubrum DSM 15624]